MPRLYFLKQKKIGGSKEAELKSKSLLELLGMMDDVGKQKAANSLKSVDPQQSLGISHLGLDGYLRKAFELLERGFPHMEGSGITGPERVRLNELRGKQATGDVLIASEQVELEDLVEKEEEEELETTSEYMGVENAALNARLVSTVVEDKINALKGVIGSLTHPIGKNVETLKDIRQALDYRKTKYATSRTTMAKQALRSASYSDTIVVPKDYAQYVENEAAGPIAELISEDSGIPITRNAVLKAPNVLRLLGPGRIYDPLDYDVIEHGGKIYVAEVKGKSRGKNNSFEANKIKAFEEIKERFPGKKVVSILLWPNEPPKRMTKSEKYYSHIPTYSYVKNPKLEDATYYTVTDDKGRVKTVYKFDDALEVDNPKHKASEAAVAHRTERTRLQLEQALRSRLQQEAADAREQAQRTLVDDSKEPEIERESKEETQAERLAIMFGTMGSQQEQSDAYNRFLQKKELPAVKKVTIQGYISKKSFPDKAVKEGLYDYFLTPTEVKKKKKPTAAEKKAAKKAEDELRAATKKTEDELLVAAIAEVDKKKAEAARVADAERKKKEEEARKKKEEDARKKKEEAARKKTKNAEAELIKGDATIFFDLMDEGSVGDILPYYNGWLKVVGKPQQSAKDFRVIIRKWEKDPDSRPLGFYSWYSSLE